VTGAVIFDLGGVLIDWDPRHLYRRLFTDPAEMEWFLSHICTADWHRAHDLGADVTESCQRLAERHPRYQGMIMAWAEHHEEMAVGQLDDTVRILAELTAAGVPCYALSNMEPEAFRVRLHRFEFLTWFAGCVISGLEKVAKPDARIFQILLDRYALEPRASVFIDDMPRNLRSARALGLQAVRFTTADALRAELRERGYDAVRPA
jgi:2-haloacid dehalogenase